MSLEKRGSHARQYYYRAARQGDRVLKTYVGTGPMAHQAAQLDADARAERKRATEQEREQLARHGAVAHVITDFLRQANTMLIAVLVSQGRHLPPQGTWRNRRDKRT